jgi:hypothetical protein
LEETWRNVGGWRSDFRVYVDLDVDCLRPLDSLFDFDSSLINPSYPIPPPGRDTALAFVGSMESSSETKQHSIPNAFMASSPRHPFWLLSISQVIHHFPTDSHSGQSLAADFGTAEATTGPGALYRSVETYRSLATNEHSQTLPQQDITPPSLSHLSNVSSLHHDLIVLDEGIIYPFSWLTDKSSEVYRRCRAQKGSLTFDPNLCQGE